MFKFILIAALAIVSSICIADSVTYVQTKDQFGNTQYNLPQYRVEGTKVETTNEFKEVRHNKPKYKLDNGCMVPTDMFGTVQVNKPKLCESNQQRSR